jgi:hypothetical protein
VLAPPRGEGPQGQGGALKPVQPPEQLAYARWLERGARLGLVVLSISFAVYLFGLADPLVPLERLPELWSLPLDEYLRQSHTPRGWGWLALAARGDLSGLLGIAILAGCALAALAAAATHYARRGDRLYALLCAAEAAIIVLAASGLLAGGHG